MQWWINTGSIILSNGKKAVKLQKVQLVYRHNIV